MCVWSQAEPREAPDSKQATACWQQTPLASMVHKAEEWGP